MVSAHPCPTDRTGLVGGSAAVLVGLPEWMVALYMALRVLIPVGLITFATWRASPRRRIALVRAYLLASTPSRHPPARVAQATPNCTPGLATFRR